MFTFHINIIDTPSNFSVLSQFYLEEHIQLNMTHTTLNSAHWSEIIRVHLCSEKLYNFTNIAESGTHTHNLCGSYNNMTLRMIINGRNINVILISTLSKHTTIPTGLLTRQLRILSQIHHKLNYLQQLSAFQPLIHFLYSPRVS